MTLMFMEKGCLGYRIVLWDPQVFPTIAFRLMRGYAAVATLPAGH